MSISNDAAAELYRLMQAHTLIEARENKREPVCDENGKIIPSREAYLAVTHKHPQLVALANSAE